MQAALNSSVLGKVVLAIEQSARLGERQITSATRLVEDLGLGRFDFLKLAIYLEEVFLDEVSDIELPDEALKRFVTVGDIVRYLSRRYFRDVELPQLAVAA